MSPRQALHDAEVAHVARALRARGCEVLLTRRRATPTAPAGDLRVNGRTVAVITARTQTKQHGVTTRGKRYVYRYSGAYWNLQSHAQRRRPVDLYVFVWLDPHGRAHRFVVPGALMSRRWNLAVLPLRPLADGRHWLCAYRNAWQHAQAAA
jgi:hypothetical protein